MHVILVNSRKANNKKFETISKFKFKNSCVWRNWCATTAAAETFIIDPFSGNINPGTTRSQKLFTGACSALYKADKLTASIANQHAVMEYITSLVQKFSWGPQVLAVKLVSDLTRTKSLITESFALSVEDLKVQAHKIWGGGVDTATSIPLITATNCRGLVLTDINVTSASTNQESKFSMLVCF